MSKENLFQTTTIIKNNFLITAFVLFFLQFLIWPLVWHLIILPKSQPSLHGFRVEPPVPINTSISSEQNFFPGNFFNLDQPNSSLIAYAVWTVPQGGSYRIRITCDDNGQVIIDNRPVVLLSGISPFNRGEGTIKLNQGKHFLKLQLNNILFRGWMKIEVLRPGNVAYQLFDIKEINYIKLGNMDTWLDFVFWVETLCPLGSIIFCFWGFLLLFLRKNQIRLFPNKKWLSFFLTLGLLAATVSGIFYTQHGLPPIWSDGLAYYSYLPAYLIYHDPSMKSLLGPTRTYGYPEVEELIEGFHFFPTTGRYLNKYPMGVAVMMFPFFLLGHFAAPLFGFIQDGFSPTYQFAVLISGIFYMLGGLYILFKIMAKHFTIKAILLTLLSLLFGTNLFNYGTIECSLSHVYSFFLICFLLYQVPLWYDNPSWRSSFFMGLMAGLILLVRNTNVYILLIILLYGITGREGLKKRGQFLGNNKRKVVLIGFTLFLVFIPQIFIWKYTTDHFLIKSYIGETFNFFSPRLFKVLFSFEHGLLVYSPILLFGIIGFGMMEESIKPYRFSFMVVLLLGWYLISSWYDWGFGHAFGHRAFIDSFGLFALPLAGFFDYFKNRGLKKTISFIVVLLILFNSYLYVQYMELILPGHVNWRIYRQAVTNPEGVYSLWQWLKDPKVNNRRVWGNSHPQLFSDK